MKADELQRFNSINGGIQSYIPALAGILIKHGLKKTIAKIDEELVRETSIPEKNNLLFIRQGLKELDELDKSGLEGRIELTASHYQSWIENSEFFKEHINELMEINGKWKEVALKAKEIFIEFEKWHQKNKIVFGITSPLREPLFVLEKLNEDFDSYLNNKNDIDRIISEIYTSIEQNYINGNIPEELDLSIFVYTIEKLNNEFVRIYQLHRELESKKEKLDELREKIENSLSSLCKELIDKLPTSAQVGLFRICEKKSKNDGYQQFPDLFGLENVR